MISNNSFFKEIPVIDIAPLVGPHDNLKSVRKTAKEIGNACKNIGFFYVKNHQIPQDHLDAVIPVMQEFFNMPEEEKTAEDIAQDYTAMGHSVDLIDAGQPEDVDDDEWVLMRARNVEHLELMVAKDYWTGEDMTAVNAAIAS